MCIEELCEFSGSLDKGNTERSQLRLERATTIPGGSRVKLPEAQSTHSGW